MKNIKEMTTPIVSVGADTEQSSPICTEQSISENCEDFKIYEQSLEEIQREFRKMSDPSYLKTVSMTELLDNVYQSKPPIADGLLYQGTYLFVGAPKLGKSLLMAQIAYHVSTGTPLWNYSTRKGTVLYLPLKTITSDCRNGYTECSERQKMRTCSFLFRQVSLETA